LVLHPDLGWVKVALMKREDAFWAGRRLDIDPFRGDIQTCIMPCWAAQAYVL
jgi:hypothetical protein